MGLARDLIPLNLEEEKFKFLNSRNYNPQFVYGIDVNQKRINWVGAPRIDLFNHSVKMIMKHGVNEESSKPFVSKVMIKKRVEQLFKELNINDYGIDFSSKMFGPVMVTDKNIVFRLPIEFNVNELENKLNHEVQTHILRRVNHNKISKHFKTEFNISDFFITEEGLASLHSYIDNYSKVVIKNFLSYIASYLAHKKGFRDVFDALVNLGVSQEKAWKISLKQKRGLKDTSYAGGYVKSHLYLYGSIFMFNWIVESKHDPKSLYFGRITADYAKNLNIGNSNQFLVPSFMENIKDYKERIHVIGITNGFDKINL